MAHITISCDTCIMDGTAACADCVVTHLLAPAPYEHRLADPRRLTIPDDLHPDDEIDRADAAEPTRVDDDGAAEERPSRSAVVFDLDELRAMRVLAEAGLVPTLRHREAH
jgi:hypothetical protein